MKSATSLILTLFLGLGIAQSGQATPIALADAALRINQDAISGMRPTASFASNVIILADVAGPAELNSLNVSHPRISASFAATAPPDRDDSLFIGISSQEYQVDGLPEDLTRPVIAPFSITAAGDAGASPLLSSSVMAPNESADARLFAFVAFLPNPIDLAPLRQLVDAADLAGTPLVDLDSIIENFFLEAANAVAPNRFDVASTAVSGNGVFNQPLSGALDFAAPGATRGHLVSVLALITSTTVQPNAVPAPGTLGIVALGCMALLRLRKTNSAVLSAHSA